MSVTLTDSRTMMAFKAGRAFRRPGTNFVDPSPVKGAIVLCRDESLLVHFMWKDRTTGEVGEDLILFPEDAKFEKVSQSSWGRTYVLKFESSDQKHFVRVTMYCTFGLSLIYFIYQFWMQVCLYYQLL